MSLRSELQKLLERWRSNADAAQEEAKEVRRACAEELEAAIARASGAVDVLEMRLRDVQRVSLQPNRLYRFLDEAGDAACASCGEPVGKQACTVCGGTNYHFLDQNDGSYRYRCCDCGLSGGDAPCDAAC